MMKRIIALLLALILTVGLLPTVALAADGDTPAAGTSSDVKNGYYEDTTWKEGTLNQGKLPTGVESVSKTAKPTSNPNEYEVTLEVVLKKTESQENPGAAATVLVLDHSGSMNGCAYCKSTTDTRGNYYHTEGCKYDKPNEWVRVTSEQSRMSAATKAVKDFIKTYSGRFDENGQETTIADLNLGRWVCLVWFNKKGGVTGGGDWVDVSNKSGYQMATDTSGWSAHDGTNLDCGLRLADYQLKQNTVAKISKNLKNVIVLSDGEPTFYLSKGVSIKGSIKIGNTKYYVHGSGKDCKKDTYNTTKSTAATLRNSASVYTVCFGASGNEIKDYDKNGNQKITVGNYLKQKIATQPKSGSNEKFAYDAADADALNTAFAAISKTIVSGLSTGTVKDTLPTGISSTVFGEGKTVMNWELNSDAFNKTEETKPLADGTKETVYTYTKTYTVTIDPDNENLVKTEDGYAPLNGKTTLTVKNSQGTDVEIPFPIPAGKVTMPSHTVTWKSQDGITTLETDNNVEYNTQPSFDQADPTKADDAQYTYTFVGWATEANKETGTLEADLPAVTADVTYYAAFSKTPRTYTVTWMPQDGKGNAYETDTGVAYNARPSYDGTEPTKAADAEHTYTFVGWATTPNQTSGSTVDALPNVTADVTYYAAFSATKQTYTIRFETEAGGTLTGTTECTGLSYGADFPAAPTTTSNVGYYFAGWYDANDNKVTDWPNTVTENATYTAKWLSYNSINLDLTGKIQKTLNSDVALTNEIFTINLTLNGAEVASATATATVSATTASGTGYTGSAPFQTATDEFKLPFKAPGTYNYSIVEEQPVRSGMTYDDGFATTGHTMTVVVGEGAEHALSITSVTVDSKSIDLTATDATWLTITNTYTEPKEPRVVSKTVVTTDMVDTLPVSVSNDIAKFKSIKTVDILYPVDNGEASTLEVPYGTKSVTLLYKITVNAGTKTSMQFEDVGAECVSIVDDDNVDVSQAGRTFTVQFYSGVTTADIYVAKTYTNLVFDSNGECTVENVISEEIKATTTVTEKEPGKYTIKFSDLIVKCLTKEGSKAFTGAEFTANVTGWKYMKEEAKPWAMLANATSFAFTDLPSRTLTATFLADAVFNPDNEAYRPFTGDTLTVEEGDYLFLIEENNGGQSNITYDEAKYWLAVRVRFEDDEPIVAVYRRTYTAGDSNNTVFENETKWSDPIPANITPVTFYNTIDTGKDDYYPIIIPTIINKDTGMLNKTDHFAYVIGYPDGTVHPNGQITRAEVATIFFRLLRDEVRDGAFTTSNSYSDVAYGKWYNNPISTMSALGIITGYPDGTFKPNKPITRAEFAAIAARFDETQSGKSATFSDVIGHWAAKEIGIAYANDWIKGYPDGTFKPDQNITRAEAMTMINRVLERKPESPADLLTNMNKWTDNMDTSKWYYLDVQEATNSHGYTRKTFNYELWRQMLPDPDWSRYER